MKWEFGKDSHFDDILWQLCSNMPILKELLAFSLKMRNYLMSLMGGSGAGQVTGLCGTQPWGQTV